MEKIAFIKRPKISIPLIMAVAVLVLAGAVIHNLKAPSVGSINQTPPAQAERTDPYAQPGTYSGKYVSFRYPAHYKQVPAKLAGTNLEVADYHTTDISGKQISVAVYPGSYGTESGISWRRQHKDIYIETDSQKWIEFTKTDGTEDTFYIEHSGLLASVAMTAPYGDQSGDGLFAASSLKWLR